LSKKTTREQGIKMLLIMYYDWFGTDESLEKWKTEWKEACDDTEGITSCKHYTSHQARYHFAWVIEVDSYNRLMEAMAKMTTTRDRNVLAHASIEVLAES
jgi:hypothetical protein